MLVVSDTGPISSLYKTGQLHLLKALFEEVILPEAVLKELMQNPAFSHVDWLAYGFRVAQITNFALLQEISKRLDAGEASAITYALTHPIAYLLIDEADGRSVAVEYNIPVLGTLGVLIKAKENKLIHAVKPHLDELVAVGFYLHTSLYNHVLVLAKEL